MFHVPASEIRSADFNGRPQFETFFLFLRSYQHCHKAALHSSYVSSTIIKHMRSIYKLVTSIYNYDVDWWRCVYTGLRIILIISGGFVAYLFLHFFITGMLLLQAELYTRNKIMSLRADLLYRTLYERMHKQCFTYRLAKSGRNSWFQRPCVCSSKLFSFSRSQGSYQHCHKLLQRCTHIFLPQS